VTAAPPSTASPHLPVASAGTTARAALRLLARRRGPLLATVALLLAGAAAALVVPPALGRIVDLVVDGRALAPIVLICGAILGAGVLAAGLTWWGGRLLVVTLQGALAELREDVFGAALGLEAGTVEQVGSADVVSRVTGDVEAVTEAVSGVLPRVIGAGFTIALTAVGLAALDPWLAVAALTAVPIQAATTAWFLRRSRPLYVRVRHQEAARGQALIETVAGAETVRAHDRAQEHLDLISRRSLDAVATQLRQTAVRTRFFGGLNAAELLGLGAVLAVGFWRVDSAAVTIGAVTAAALFFHRLFGPIGQLLTSIDDLQRAQAGLERLVGVLQIARPAREGRQIALAGVEIRGLDFTFPGQDRPRRALVGVDLDLAPGSTTVLVGASGSGKSTLARVVAGALAPGSGSVRIGGVAAEDARSGDRPAVLLVTQETHLFTGSVAENLRLARPAATDEELRAALEAVDARWALDLGAPPASTLDEARIQQLALARVLLADPPVVVLDEATAEAGSEGTLDRAVAAVTAGRTAIVVAHRLVHVEQADLVVVMEDGRLAESGRPAELLRTDGPFARLWEAWHRDRTPAPRHG
jgi:ABC-type multidrug transport system fused ATPase/permease subunit